MFSEGPDPAPPRLSEPREGGEVLSGTTSLANDLINLRTLVNVRWTFSYTGPLSGPLLLNFLQNH